MATLPVLPDETSDPSAPYGRNVQLLRLLGLAVTVGILGALAVLAFHQMLLALEAALYGSNQGLVADATRLPPAIRALIPALGGLAVIRPEVWGNGYSVVNSLLHQPWLWQSVLLILVLKVIATVLTSGSGASMSAFTLVGMSAFLAAVTHAPLTAVVMVSEMTSGRASEKVLVQARHRMRRVLT